MQLFLLSKASLFPVSNGSKPTSNLHYLSYALCSMLYGFWQLAAAALYYALDARC
jgi:hypothetical protein